MLDVGMEYLLICAGGIAAYLLICAAALVAARKSESCRLDEQKA